MNILNILMKKGWAISSQLKSYIQFATEEEGEGKEKENKNEEYGEEEDETKEDEDDGKEHNGDVEMNGKK